MRIGIMGAGAVGTFVGALLAERSDVVLIGRPGVADCI
ncbi:MAG: 2-dehydropantoate 2-reductase, partial [Thermoplasmata archaeon]|nr:2-dehydropantoate 2-reductase [Thermoplasmata archaeon]